MISFVLKDDGDVRNILKKDELTTHGTCDRQRVDVFSFLFFTVPDAS